MSADVVWMLVQTSTGQYRAGPAKTRGALRAAAADERAVQVPRADGAGLWQADPTAALGGVLQAGTTPPPSLSTLAQQVTSASQSAASAMQTATATANVALTVAGADASYLRRPHTPTSVTVWSAVLSGRAATLALQQSMTAKANDGLVASLVGAALMKRFHDLEAAVAQLAANDLRQTALIVDSTDVLPA